MKFAVIGAGMIGAAAARHLTLDGHDVTLIGPGEPQDRTRHDGVFASHYDEGRITRGLDPSPFWSRASRASIARYDQIAAAAGIRFYSPVGCMMAGPSDSAQAADMVRIAARDGIACDRLDLEGLRAKFPYFAFPDDTIGLYEGQDAGHISPRALVQAQIALALRGGARHVAATVNGIDEGKDGVILTTDQGRMRFDRVLVATGGFTTPLLGDAVPLTVYGRTVVLFEVSDAEAARLTGMPALIYLDPPENHPYLLPAIRYPDGKHYLKMGGPTVDPVLRAQADLSEWFRSEGDAAAGREIEAMLRERMPDLDILSVTTLPCVTTYTEKELPRIGALTDRVFAAVGGCGRAAKNSDELGRLAALSLTDRPLPAWCPDLS